MKDTDSLSILLEEINRLEKYHHISSTKDLQVLNQVREMIAEKQREEKLMEVKSFENFKIDFEKKSLNLENLRNFQFYSMLYESPYYLAVLSILHKASPSNDLYDEEFKILKVKSETSKNKVGSVKYNIKFEHPKLPKNRVSQMFNFPHFLNIALTSFARQHGITKHEIYKRSRLQNSFNFLAFKARICFLFEDEGANSIAHTTRYFPVYSSFDFIDMYFKSIQPFYTEKDPSQKLKRKSPENVISSNLFPSPEGQNSDDIRSRDLRLMEYTGIQIHILWLLNS